MLPPDLRKRRPWTGTPTLLQNLGRLQQLRAGRPVEGPLEAWTHVSGLEFRLSVDGEVVRSLVCQSEKTLENDYSKFIGTLLSEEWRYIEFPSFSWLLKQDRPAVPELALIRQVDPQMLGARYDPGDSTRRMKQELFGEKRRFELPDVAPIRLYPSPTFSRGEKFVSVLVLTALATGLGWAIYAVGSWLFPEMRWW